MSFIDNPEAIPSESISTFTSDDLRDTFLFKMHLHIGSEYYAGRTADAVAQEMLVWIRSCIELAGDDTRFDVALFPPHQEHLYEIEENRHLSSQVIGYILDHSQYIHRLVLREDDLMTFGGPRPWPVLGAQRSGFDLVQLTRSVRFDNLVELETHEKNIILPFESEFLRRPFWNDTNLEILFGNDPDSISLRERFPKLKLVREVKDLERAKAYYFPPALLNRVDHVVVDSRGMLAELKEFGRGLGLAVAWVGRTSLWAATHPVDAAVAIASLPFIDVREMSYYH